MAHGPQRTGLRRGPVALAAVAALAATGAYIGAGVGRSDASARSTKSGTFPARSSALAPSVPPTLQVRRRSLTPNWTAAAWVGGRPAAWVARRSGVTLMRIDQQLVHLSLHAGSSDGGTVGWAYGDRIAPREIRGLVAAVNGGFKLTYTNVGFMSGGHVAVPLEAGLASIVTYTDGTTDIGAWEAGVPSPRKAVFSVLQNQRLLVDHGVAAANLSSCIVRCWGGTIGLLTVVARSGIGITATGQLVWAAGEHLSPSGLAAALMAAGAVRAIELDINPWWVAGYLYPQHPAGPTPVPLVRGQRGIAGAFFKPYSRDILTFVAN